jgi:tetratricopeptide (TPR) repeat protein
MADLEPYVCPFMDCPTEHVTMRDYSAWFNHMSNVHTAQWSCTARQCRSFTVVTRDEWEEHMHQTHPDSFTEAQLPWLEKKARKASSIIFSTCPLCDYVPQVSTAAGVGSAEHLQTLSNFIVKHLATHLEQMSQIALPWQDDFQLPNEDDRLSSSQVERDSVKDEEGPDTESLTFQDEGVAASHGREQNLNQWIEISKMKSGDDAAPAFEDWEYYGLDQTPYFGHDRDPTLQTFLQKMYLDVNPTTYGGRGPDLPAELLPVMPVSHFFGRDYALQALSHALVPRAQDNEAPASPTSFPRTFAVYAPGGMGKTQLSAAFVSQNRDKFDAIFWVHADDYNKLSQGFQNIAVELGLVEETSADAKDISFTREIVKQWLLNPLKDFRDAGKPNAPQASWLLVFDGVENPDVLNDFWPYNGPGSVLITSRSPFSWSRSLQLAPFTEDEAIKFLLKLTEKDASEEQRKAVGKVNDQLGGLPLALAQMAGLIQHKQLSFAEFLESYNEQEELLRQANSDLVLSASGYEHTLASVWAFENLAYGVPMLNLVSMLDPDGIPESLLTASLGRPKRRNSIQALWTAYDEYTDARNELVACSLLSRDKIERRLSIHRLVQDVARARMSPREFRSNFMTCVDLISSSWPFEKFDWRHDVSKWTVCEPLFPHVARLKSLYHEVSPSEDYSEDDYSFARLLTAAGWYHHERGRSSDAKIFNNLAEEICKSLQKRLKGSTTDLSQSHHLQLDRILAEIDHNRGCIATEVNEPSDALKYHLRFNDLMQKELGDVRGGQDMRLAISWNELGNAYMLNRRWEDGRHCFEQSITLMKQLDNYEEILISLPLVNIGLAYWLLGRHNDALKVLLEGLQHREVVYGQDDRDHRVSFM